MRNLIPAFAVLALLTLMGSSPAAAERVRVQYTCAKPRAGNPCVQYNWYVCWPDSNTATLATTSDDTVATITHVNAGERVRVEGVDASNHVGPRSVASLPWDPPPQARRGRGRGNPHLVYANPFNPSKAITVELDETARVTLEIYNVAGERVRTLIDADLPAGTSSVNWDARDERGLSVASGVYFCSVAASGEHETMRLVLVR